MNLKINVKQKRMFLIAMFLAPMMLLIGTITTSNITHRYDIIPSLNKVSALECSGSGISQLFCDPDMLDLGNFEFFEIMPFAKNYEGTESSLVVIIVDLLSCLFVLSIIFAFIIAFKIMVQEMAPWGEESAEKFKRAKNKYLELGKAFIIPAIIFVVIITISSIFGVKAPLGINYLTEGLGIPAWQQAFPKNWASQQFSKKISFCVDNDSDNAMDCIERMLPECYNSARENIDDSGMVELAIRSCNDLYVEKKECFVECSDKNDYNTSNYRNCIKRCN